MEGNKGVRGGQGYEGVRRSVETVFFHQIMNPLLHLQFDPCKIRAEPLLSIEPVDSR
jgi:hypothetical protein